MKRKSILYKDLEVSRAKEIYDESCKNILANKIILAWIMKSCMKEYKDCSIRDIADHYIEGIPEISQREVHRDEAPASDPGKIRGENTEDKAVNEGTVRYDIMFRAILPQGQEKIELIINIEAQKDFYPGYPLIKRGIYYGCRMISSQYGTIFINSHYEKIQKVYSIWICFNPPEKRKNSINIYSVILIWFVGEILISYHWMKVNRYPVTVRNLPYTDTVTDAGFKMVVISDLHDHEFGKDNEKLIRCVKEQDPEMIILDGDMLNEDSKSDEVPVRLVKGLAEIASVYYALGNHELDYIGTAEGKKMQKHPENSELVKDLTDAGACVLEEGYRDVEIGGCKVRIGGMYEYAFALDGDNSAENLTGDVRDFLEEFQNTDRYKIMLCHRPDSFVFGDASDYWKIDLVISGHDHGGQVVIPFKGGLYGGDQGWFPPYVHGLYRTGRIRLFVTSGLSSEKQKLPRWNNRPEIAVLNVH